MEGATSQADPVSDTHLCAGLIRPCGIHVLFYKRFVSMEMHAKSLCGARAAVNPARRELKFLCMDPAAAAAAAQLMGNRLRGTWPMGIR